MRLTFKKRISAVLIVLGVLLLAGALTIFIKTSYDNANAGEHARQTVEQIREEITDQSKSSASETVNAAANEKSGHSSSEEAVIVIDGKRYLGYLSFTGYDKVLPVLADWSFDDLQYAPARFSGSVSENDLVIGAHNYFSHFYLLNEMTEGNEVVLTLADGTEIHYIVKKIERLSPAELDKLTAGEHDMTLFSCTPTGRARATVRCDRLG